MQVRKAMATREPDLGEIVRLAREFGVSKEAMARTYVDAQRQAIAVMIIHHGRLGRVYRHIDLPWIAPQIGQVVPADSIASGHRLQPGALTDSEECEAEVWFDERNAARIEVLTEQLLGQNQGFSMLLLHAELTED